MVNAGRAASCARNDDLCFSQRTNHGLEAHFTWLDGQCVTASTLILDQLLPLARQGLRKSEVDETDIDKYLDIIEERARSRQTGARWIRKAFAETKDEVSKDIRQRMLTSAMLAHQKEGKPVHLWPEIKPEETGDWAQGYRTVSQFMERIFRRVVSPFGKWRRS